MNDKTRCGDCTHYSPKINEATNRPLPSKPGNCTYPVNWPTLPNSFIAVPWGPQYVAMPTRFPVWPRDGHGCPVFNPAKAAKQKPKQDDLL